ncbi:MAG: dihydrofolate reductase family protein [Bacteroidota bacterium]|jgi:dihydrofolate reductase
MERNLILYIAMSLDGYIAKLDGDLSWLSAVEKEGEDYGYHKFVASVDTVIVGRKTYDKVLSMGVDYPHQDKMSYIITRTPNASLGNIHFYTEDVTELVKKLKAMPGKNIYCDGGAEIVNLLLNNNLFDELVISIVPVLLGGGIELFKPGRPENKLQLVSSQAFESGLVQVHYKVQGIKS